MNDRLHNLDDFLLLLRGVKSSKDGQYTALCPGHDDKNRSLSIKDVGGKLLLKCFAGCSIDDILQPLKLQPGDLFLNGNKPKSEHREIVAVYHYDGFEVVRMRPKGFYQRRPDGQGGYINNLKGITPTLYHQAELPPAIAAGTTVYVVEGEKDVDRLRAEGFTATTSPMGAGKWRDSYSQALTGADLVFIPDADAPGRKHMVEAARSCYGKATRIRVLELDGKDTSEWLDNGHTAAELTQLVSQCSDYELPAASTEFEASANRIYNRSDAGNAEFFRDSYADRVRYDHKRSRWLEWNKHYWRTDNDGQIMRLALKAVRFRAEASIEIDDFEARKKEAIYCISSEQRSKLEAMLSIAKNLLPIADTGDDWDSDPWLFCVANGVIDLRTGELRKGQPKDRITMKSNVVYDPDAKCPRWIQFQNEIHSGNAELIDWKQRYLGYALTGNTQEQIWALRYGTGSNGKGVEDGTLRHTLGDYCYDAPFSTFELNQRSAIPNDMAALVNRRFVTSSETNEGSRLNEARIKQLTGQDPVTARFLHAEFFTFQPTLKLWLSVNHKPIIRDDSHGMWRRVCLIPYNETFDGDRRDNNLSAKLKAEASGILNWLIVGCLESQKRGLSDRPEAIVEATNNYRADSDDLGDFLAAKMTIHEQARISGREFYKIYKAWAIEEGLHDREILTTTKFGRIMGGKFKKIHKEGGTQYFGVGTVLTGLLTGFEPTENKNMLQNISALHKEKTLKNPSDLSFSLDNPSVVGMTGFSEPVSNPSVEPELIPDCPVCGCSASDFIANDAGDIVCPVCLRK